MHYGYECSVCGVSLTSSFYLCSNCHVSCSDCYLDSTPNNCQICKLGRIYCCEFSKYRMGRRNDECPKTRGPVVVLPDPTEREWRREATNAGYSATCSSCSNRLMKCLDCRKCIFMSRVLEHYVREHNGRLICPVPPASMVTFQIKANDMKVNQVEILHLLQLLDTSDTASSLGDDSTSSEGDEKLLFLMGTKVPFYHSKHETLNMIKLWLFATYHACSTNYSLEVNGTKHDSVSLIFTGVPTNVSQSELEPKNRYERIHSLSVRESVVRHLEHNGGCMVNLYIHQNHASE